jgi:hypothetical protein
MSVLKTLTEGIEPRDLYKESSALLSKWERTGLLEGLNSDDQRNQMARLLENQAKELLRESSTMAGGDVEGFAAVAFPLVRRVFASLVAQDLVSVQPMSLPSGLIFFLDFTYGTEPASAYNAQGSRLGNVSGSSIYGGGRVASQITGGVILSQPLTELGPYSLNNGFASPTASSGITTTIVASGSVTDGGLVFDAGSVAAYQLQELLQFDPDLPSGSSFAAATFPLSSITTAATEFNADDFVAILPTVAGATYIRTVRRLTRIDPTDATKVLLVAWNAAAAEAANLSSSLDGVDGCDHPQKDNLAAGSAIGSVIGASDWGLEGSTDIPEIDIKVDSVSVTAVTKKLKAKWTPELGQDLNAYHNMDAEVELTSILSEQVALEIDREILEDLVKGATAETLYWSRRPGTFVNRTTGEDLTGRLGDFTGNVSEWYETLIETINDVSAQIHRKTLRGGANFIVVSPEMANILEFTAGFRAAVTHDDDRGTVGAVRVGSLSKKLDVYVDPYFLRNVVLVGRRGASFLESGYVYAPYVPLQVTPTIFGVEDFVPRKGVMTRYAKKMVRPDMYGLVICKDFLG